MDVEERRHFVAARTGPVQLADGTELVLRPVVPDDKALFRAAFERLSPLSRYRRFLSPLPRLNPALLAYLTDVDHRLHAAWVAVVAEEAGPAAVGVARAIRLDDPRGAEVAITVIDHYQRRGIGRLLLATLVLEAVEQGVIRFVGLVLADNDPMRAVLRRAGARLYPEEVGTLRFEMDVPAAAGDLKDCPLYHVLRSLARGEAALSRQELGWRPPLPHTRAAS
ncbi:MAG: GNAT family N-acetyltransferase [Acidimicrobiia bacterium]